MQPTAGLTNLQLELLKLFKYNLDEQQLAEVRSLLSDYFAQQVTTDMDKLFEEKGWGAEQIDTWSKEHMRTKYKAS